MATGSIGIGIATPTLDATQHPALRGVTVDTGGGVVGINQAADSRGELGTRDGVYHQSAGVYGQSPNQGVFGHGVGDAATGVYGQSSGAGIGVRGESTGGVAVQGQCFGAGRAGRFIGAVAIEGDLTLSGRVVGDLVVTGDVKLPGADCAENFDLAVGAHALPGMVMVIGDDGSVHPSRASYDRRVAGVVSGAGHYRPGLVLHSRTDGSACTPLALVGKVFCLVDADAGAVGVGDLLTSSHTPGHAMKAADPARAFGAVLGKALAALPSGRGLVPVLVALQ